MRTSGQLPPIGTSFALRVPSAVPADAVGTEPDRYCSARSSTMRLFRRQVSGGRAELFRHSGAAPNNATDSAASPEQRIRAFSAHDSAGSGPRLVTRFGHSFRLRHSVTIPE